MISFSLVWILGFGGFHGEWIAEVGVDLGEHFGVTISPTFLVLAVVIAVNGTIGLVVAFGAIGEEIGWRGFMVPELYKHYNFTKVALISGTIWRCTIILCSMSLWRRG